MSGIVINSALTYHIMTHDIFPEPLLELPQELQTIDEILAWWRQLEKLGKYDAKRIQGGTFEELCQAFLVHDPTQKQIYKSPVQTYGDWAEAQGLDETDDGVDLVAELKVGGFCAIQCKFYVEGRKVKTKHVKDFITASSKKYFKRRLLMDTTGVPLTPKGELAVRDQDPPVSRIQLHDFRASPMDWAKYVHTKTVERKTKPKTPRPHQVKAIENVVKGLRNEGKRGMLIMACGTGKTFTSLRVAEELCGQSGKVLYLVPSLALMAQTVREWAADTIQSPHFLAVCSDAQVGRRKPRGKDKDKDRIAMDASDLGFHVTTDPAKITEGVACGEKERFTVVFATYQSLRKVREAQQEHGLLEFDLTICDEAHRTAGASGDEEEREFSLIHNQAHVRTKRRLYMTATPKIYHDKAKDKAKEEQMVLYSMEPGETYGKVLYEIGFGEAVDADILTDYKVIVLTIPEEGVEHTMRKMLASENMRLDQTGKLIGAWRAIAKVDRDEFGQKDTSPMRRVIAYTTKIKNSEWFAENFAKVVEEYRNSRPKSEAEYTKHTVVADHVDGTQQAMERSMKLDWLERVGSDEDVCHVLSNVRVLSEGVDVPALDAILFMEPRGSAIEVVQAVGRVMRKSGEKKMGYVILPILVREGEDWEDASKRRGQFKVVVEVLNALRSHDPELNDEINMVEDGLHSKRLEILPLQDWYPAPEPPKKEIFGDWDVDRPNPTSPLQLNLNFEEVHEAIRTTVVEKCGDRKYWETWAKDVSDIAQRYILRIQKMVEHSETHEAVFNSFLAELRDDLNEGITKNQAIEMLSQHMVTAPVFNAILGSAHFVEENPISKAMQVMFEVLEPEQMSAELEGLENFYDRVARKAQIASRTKGDAQKLLINLYEDFFKKAFPSTSEKLGVVYTPIEIVDFILNSVNSLLLDEFGESLSSEGVGILDPFTGTGTFITRMIQSGLIDPKALKRKYHSEIHANEITLLAYYIAAVNIEQAYHEAVDLKKYKRFLGIILTDTFNMVDRSDEIKELMLDNSEQRERQMDASILAIVGNPPWRVGQESANDDAQNQPYPELDRKIRTTYAARSSARLSAKLRDRYVLAIRWASDRIGEKGVIGLVTNSGWLRGAGMDGMRKSLAEEFTSIYVSDLRGNINMGDPKEGGNVFDVRVGVSMVFLVKNPLRTGCTIHYFDIGDSLKKEVKLNQIKEWGGINGLPDEWNEIIPDEYGDWLGTRDESFSRFIVLGNKGRAPYTELIFKNYSHGVSTNRDTWCYNYSESILRENIRRLIQSYNTEREHIAQRYALGHSLTLNDVISLTDDDATKIKWSADLHRDLSKNRELEINEGRVVIAQFRPFTRKHMYFSDRLNERVGQMSLLFPHAEAKNLLICVMGNEESSFSCMMVQEVPNLHFIKSNQCFPLWLYRIPNDSAIFSDKEVVDTHGFVKESAITDWALDTFQQKMGGGGQDTQGRRPIPLYLWSTSRPIIQGEIPEQSP